VDSSNHTINSIWLRKCVTLVVRTKGILLLSSTKQNTSWGRPSTLS